MAIQSLWIDLIQEAEGKPDQKETLEKLVTQLKEFSENRKLDDSAHAAWAIAADVAGDRLPLRTLLSSWSNDSSKNVDLKLRNRLFSLAVLRLHRAGNEIDDSKLIDTLMAHVAKWDGVDQIPLFAELGRQALSQKDVERAKAFWGQAAKLTDSNQLQILDLAIVAANADFSDLSITSALASAKRERSNCGQ